MRKLWKSHSHAVISSLAILALIGIIVESKGSRGLPNFFSYSTSLWLWPKDRSTIGHGVAVRGVAGAPTIDPLVHSLAVIHNSSTLAKKVCIASFSVSLLIFPFIGFVVFDPLIYID